MSAEDVGRVGGTEERGGEEERRVNERRYRTLTCFGLISTECFVPKPLALIWGLQHLELIITHTVLWHCCDLLCTWLLHPLQYKLYVAYVLELGVTQGFVLRL